MVVGLAPGVVALADGSFQVPNTPLARLLDASLPDASPDGDYNVLLLGDARVLPVPATEYRDGVSWAIIDDGALDVPRSVDAAFQCCRGVVTTALDEMARRRRCEPAGSWHRSRSASSSSRNSTAVTSTVNDPLPLPTGLVEALEDQLDLVALRPGLPTLEAFENRAWIPKQAQLDAAEADASAAAGAEVLVRSDLSGSSPLFIDADQLDTVTDDVSDGVVHLGHPVRRRLDAVGRRNAVEPRRAFGETTAFDVSSAGVGSLRYETSALRWLAVAAQTLLWLAAIVIAARGPRLGRTSRSVVARRRDPDRPHRRRRPVLVDPGSSPT